MELNIDLNAAIQAAEAAISTRHEAGEDPTRWDMVPAALAAQISNQLTGVDVDGLDAYTVRVMQCDARGTLLPPSQEGRAAFDAVAEALRGTGFGVQYVALNGSWDHMEAESPWMRA
jgi:hypothetical protein